MIKPIPLLHLWLARIADLELRKDANAETPIPLTAGYAIAEVEYSQEFTREQRVILRRCGIGTFGDESEDDFPDDEIGEEEEVDVAIFDVLGRYFHKERKVVLYEKVISHVATSLGIPVGILTEIVLAHEIAHAVTHFGAEENGAIWEYFGSASTEDKELLAQLLPFMHYQNQEMDEHIAAMMKLGEHQPNKYNTWQSHKNDSWELVQSQVRSMRRKPLTNLVLNTWRVTMEQRNFTWSSGLHKTTVESDGSVFYFNNQFGGGDAYPDSHGTVTLQQLPNKANDDILSQIEARVRRAQSIRLPVNSSPPMQMMDGGSLVITVTWKGQDKSFSPDRGGWGMYQDFFVEFRSLIEKAELEAR